MNKTRKRLIKGSRDDLIVINDDISRIRRDELGNLASQNITMHSYTTRQSSENAISSLTDVISHIHKAIDKLDNIL